MSMSALGPDGGAGRREKARDIARRYGCEFVDLRDVALPSDFHGVPKDLMLRYNFVPIERLPNGDLVIVVADPSQLMLIDEIRSRVGSPLVVKVSSLNRIRKVLRRVDAT